MSITSLRAAIDELQAEKAKLEELIVEDVERALTAFQVLTGAQVQGVEIELYLPEPLGSFMGSDTTGVAERVVVRVDLGLEIKL